VFIKQAFVPTTRTWSNSTFVSGAVASGKHTEAEAHALVDEMFKRYEVTNRKKYEI
jgi:hypothetical protein